MEVRSAGVVVVVLLLVALTPMALVTVGAFNSRLNELDAIDDFDIIPASTKLTPQNFRQQIRSAQYYLVLFYAPWSEYCQQLLPHWIQLADLVSDRLHRMVQVGHVDCIGEEAFCSRMNVGDYPTVRAYSRGPPVRYEVIPPYELGDTIEYLQEYVFTSTKDQRHG
ncbi:thioredoxin domain-containing protein 5-like [Wyeomyia smithii]|uniref:thioredoxin domain-containing protein 5-like n=1 Tax=Wyeomyia smithii TaxID=174621 RepID=UPI0024681DD8|nr:thioredoxin domain-containing protein 5-like [Wyeomyia smithii]